MMRFSAKFPIRNVVACFIGGASLLGLVACTTIRIEASPDKVTIERRLGGFFVSIGGSAEDAHVAEVKSLGVVSTPLGVSAGYSHQRWVQMPDSSCRLVLWVDDPAMSDMVRRLASEVPRLCVVTNEAERDGK